MNIKVVLILIALAAFVALTGYVRYDVGILVIFGAATANPVTIQIVVALVIVCFLACVWMFSDGHKGNLNPWLYIVITVLAGAFGPLLYLLRREWGGAGY